LKFFSFKVLTTKHSNVILSIIVWMGFLHLFSTFFSLIYSYAICNYSLLLSNELFFFNSLPKMAIQLLQLDLISLYGLQLYTTYSFILLAAGVLLSLVILAALRITKSFDKKQNIKEVSKGAYKKNYGSLNIQRHLVTFSGNSKNFSSMLNKSVLTNSFKLFAHNVFFMQKKRFGLDHKRINSPSLASYIATTNSMFSIVTRIISIILLLLFVLLFVILPVFLTMSYGMFSTYIYAVEFGLVILV